MEHGLAGAVQPDVVAVGLDPVDTVDGHQHRTIVEMHENPREVLPGGDALEHVVHRHGARHAVRRVVACPGQGLREAVGRHRLEQIVQRAHLEGPQGMLVVSGHEDHLGHRVGPHGFDDIESGTVRHLDIMQHEIGVERTNGRDRSRAIVGLAGHGDPGFGLQHAAQPRPGWRFIVHQQHAELSHRARPLAWGRSCARETRRRGCRRRSGARRGTAAPGDPPWPATPRPIPTHHPSPLAHHR